MSIHPVASFAIVIGLLLVALVLSTGMPTGWLRSLLCLGHDDFEAESRELKYDDSKAFARVMCCSKCGRVKVRISGSHHWRIEDQAQMLEGVVEQRIEKEGLSVLLGEHLDERAER